MQKISAFYLDKQKSFVPKKNMPHFFSNKKFLFVKIERWNFQHLFDLKFRETLQNFSVLSSQTKKFFS